MRARALGALEAEGGERRARPVAVESGGGGAGPASVEPRARFIVRRRVLEDVVNGEVEAHELTDGERRGSGAALDVHRDVGFGDDQRGDAAGLEISSRAA